MLKGIIRFFNLMHIAMVRVAQFLMIVMVCIIFTNVILRYVFNSGLMWSEEVALLLAVWFIFIAMALGVKQDLHINITVIPDSFMKAWMLRLITIIKSVIVCCIGLVMLLYGWKLTQLTMTSIMPATQWPAGMLYAILPFSALFMIYEAIADLCKWDTCDKDVDEYLAGNISLKKLIGGSKNA